MDNTTTAHDNLSNGHPVAPITEQNDNDKISSTQTPTEAEVQAIADSIAAASSSSAAAAVEPTSQLSQPPPAESTAQVDDEKTNNEIDQSTPPEHELHALAPFDEGAYWDIPSMAPLNAASAVSI